MQKLAENVLKADIFHPIDTYFDEISKHSDRLGFVIVTSEKGSDLTKKKADNIIKKYYPDFHIHYLTFQNRYQIVVLFFR